MEERAMAEKALAAVAVRPNVMELREIELPTIGDDDALVRLEACGICGTDYEWFRGDLSIAYPVVLGHEPLGVIAAIGAEASQRWGVKVGDRVAVRSQYRCGRCEACRAGGGRPCPAGGGFGSTSLERPPGLWGGYAEYLYLPPGAVVYRMDPTLPPEVAVMFNPLGAGFAWAVDAPGLQPGQTIAILGPGQRGLCAVIAAREAGAAQVIVTGLGRDAHKLALARELGADAAIDVEAEDPVARVQQLTGGQGVDVVLDTTPYAVQAVAQAVAMVREGGTVIVAGLKGRRPLTELSSDDLVWKQMTVKGVRGVPFGAFQRAVETIEARRYPLHKLHTHTFPIEAAEQALKTLAGETGEAAIHVAIVPRPRG
jgi:threonine dehydrogenase-like Zn-dependent dehydrogenase